MRTINTQQISDAVKKLCRDANVILNSDIFAELKESRDKEENKIAQDILDILIENARLAAERSQPLCQDTGIGVFFIELGQQVHIKGGDVNEVIYEAMSEVYINSPYRLSVVADPYFGRVNTNNNLPPIIHWKLVPGSSMSITYMPKGGGAENMSTIKMFTPLTPIEDIKKFIIDTVKNAGGKPCPPIIVGVGIGGSFDYAAFLAKKALLMPLNSSNQDKNWAEVEADLLKHINLLDIGPMGLGGSTTALKVNILTYPCHIASLPVAVNLQCHSHRYKTVIL